MEGTTAVDTATSSDPYMYENDVISFHSDSSGDTHLQTALEQQFSDDKSKQMGTPRRQSPSDHREDVPNDTPPRKRNGKDRRRQRPVSLQEDLSPIPYSWYRNPYSQRDYSPSLSSVTPRKTISSWMEAMMRTPKNHDAQTEDTENDDDSIDSVEQLEQVAAQIRSEIRQAELQELADEAESAAEAGQESFAGRASTFGDSSHSSGYGDLNDLNPKQQYKLKRYKTYSEGTSLLKQAALRPVRRTRPKIRCLQLRDINEVIPSFRDVHSHLKKHLVLAGVEEQSLDIEFTSTEGDSRARRRAGRRTPVQFLSSLKSWVSTSSARSKLSAPQSPSTDVASNVTTPWQTTARRSDKPVLDSLEADTAVDECSESTFASHVSKEETYEVGGRLAGHLHAPKAVTRSSIRIPTGLDIPQDLGIPHEMPPKMLSHHDVDRTDVDTVDTVPTSSSSQQDEANQDDKGSPQRNLGELEPIALFQHVGDDASSAGGDGHSVDTGSSSNSMQPVSPKESAGERWADSLGSNMFITPMRLRGIRRDSRRLAFDRSLSHKSADLGWTLKAFKQTRQSCSGSNLPAHDDQLNLPLLSVKSDGDISPPMPLNYSKDESVVSLPADISFIRRDETSLSLFGPPLFADEKQELSQVVESTGSMIAELDRPKSLSFDEHDVVGIALQEFSESLNDFQDINTEVPMEENLFDGCLDDDSGNGIALQSKLSVGDLSDNIAECDESNVSVAAPAFADLLDTKENDDDLANVVKGGRDLSGTQTGTPSLDVSLLLMPTLDKIDEQRHAKDTDENSDTEGEEKLQITSDHVSIPRIEQRSIDMNDVSAILEAEADNLSLHSLDMSNLFNSEAETEDSYVQSGAMNGDVQQTNDALQSTEQHDAEVYLRRRELFDPISEFYAKEEALDVVTGTEKESFPCEEIGPSDPVSDFYASELTFDPIVATRSTTDYDGAESENDQQCKTEVIELPQFSDNIEEGVDVRNAEEQVISLGDLSIDVKALNESSSDIVHRYQEGVKIEHSPSRCLKREEILKSSSGRVKVTIELSLHDDDTDDDDDVRSEGTSVHTPQAHPCECLINAATHLEENVRSDLAKAGECARIRYGHHTEEEDIETESSALPRPDQQVSSPTHIMTESPPRESTVQSSMTEQRNQQRWSPMRRTNSCPSILNLAEEEVETSMISSATMPNNGLALAQRKATAIHHRSLSERRDYLHSYSMLDPCQSTSPFKETMDDMMKSFSPTTEFEKERNAILEAQENHEFLSNYLYSSKPIGEGNTDTIEANMCGDQCGYLSDALDSYRSFIPMRSTSNKDMLSLNTRDKPYSSSAASETWFDVASEHFDGALEKFMGRAHAQSKRWNSMFRAPGLKSKKDIEKASASRNNGVKGILLVKQPSKVDLKQHSGEVSEQQFESLYGLPREQFEQLPVTERSILHDIVHKNLGMRTARAPLQVGLEPPSPAVSARSLSSLDLAMMGEVRI